MVAEDLVDQITVASQTGVTAKGDPAYGAQVAIAARVQVGEKATRSAGDAFVMATHTIYTLTAVKKDDRIWVLGANTGDVSAARRPLSVESTHDLEGGFTLYKILLSA